MWSLAYRQHAHYGIDTNNYVESWHGNLKINYLGLIKKQRIDHVICVLTREVIPDYVRRLVQCSTGIKSRTLCAKEKAARKEAQALTSEQVFSLVQGTPSHDTITISSSTGSGSYDVDRDLTQCSCPAFASSGLACKHMFIGSRFFGLPVRWRLPSNASWTVPSLPPGASNSANTTNATQSLPGLLPDLPLDQPEPEPVVAERECVKEKTDMVESILKELQRTSTAAQKLSSRSGSDLHGRASRAELQQAFADVISARRVLESL
ncbi:unnamed protein product [Tilletia controversa]|nr:unnamed protein product [Tilletia controversa]